MEPARGRTSWMRRIVGLLLLAGGLFWGPWAFLALTTDVADLEHLEAADAAIVFGAIVRQGRISPLHQERLDTAIMVRDGDKAPVIVVSNAPVAAGVMAQYLLDNGVPPAAIEIDPTAETTPETCVAEAARSRMRDVILISQRYHLPRLAFQCRKLGVSGQLLPAETALHPSRESTALATKVRVRTHRYVREAVLTWGAVLGVYRRLQ